MPFIMYHMRRISRRVFFLWAGVVLASASAVGCTAGAPTVQDSPSPSVAAEAVTPPAKNTTMEDYRRKIDAQLLQAIESAEGDAAATTSPVLSMVPVNADGTVDISIRAAVTKDLVQQIEATGAQVIHQRCAQHDQRTHAVKHDLGDR